jgi:transposase-like protein
MTDMDLPKLVERFGSEDKCRAYLETLRWPEGVTCPRCQGKKVSRIAKRGQFDCDSCRHQFSVTAGTIFHDTHLPLWKWLLAIYMIAESKKGISSNQLKRTLKVSYKTAWHLSHRIRAAMKDDSTTLLDGIVEVDETYVGGRQRNIGRNWRKKKTLVVGAADRDGDVRLTVIGRATKKNLHSFIVKNVEPGSTIHTDEHPGYNDLDQKGFAHETVEHGAGKYVRANVHTNTVEGVWSLFKRSLVGSYHQLSTKHMNAYLHETAFRYNNRSNPHMFRDALLKLLASPSVPFAKLVAGS